MSENDDAAELLFFDTFSHEVDTDINLDLVQFPKPVYITQVRIIPLGARVQADFPGGVRLGATNPSKFNIEFFVNDLGMPGASTFENLGQLDYNQNDCIHLECTPEKIPTDGLVLRGWYSTITLAVYGILTNSMNEPIASPPPPPCEPVAPEDICNLSGDGRNSVMPEEDAKEDWKEPLPGEVVAASHAHKTSTSDYEREDLDYNITREHYQHSGDERRTRKASHSSEHSVSSRNRTHSESNERDYIRSRSDRERKSSRDWSRSPEYSARRPHRKRSERSRSDVEEPHKWPPRTPPISIDSPTRPRSPDNVEYVDEEDDVRYKLKSRSYMRSSESLINIAQETHVIDDDETPSTPGEQFEPILSDDEIIGDDDSNTAPEQIAAGEFEMEIIAAATAAKPAIAEFDAFKAPILKYERDLHAHYSKELENLKLLFKKFELQTKIDSLAGFKDATTSVDERENFVYLSEQLINQLSYLAQQFKRRNFVLQQFFKSDTRNLRQGFDIFQIALDFEAACLQQQPAFKIRHIKVGARLAELFGVSAEFFEYLQERKYEPFTVLFALYQEDYMALSIKLMLLKAVYALLDTKAGVRHFLASKLNGYQLILNSLQQTHLTRTKYALKAIIKKMNLNEALECICENCTKLFIFSNYQQSAYAESYLLIEQAIEQVLDALTLNALSFQQPKRFLPVSKKFEIFPDSVAQRSFANALQAYFTQHSLGESMLLLFANAAQLPVSLLLRCLDLLEAMLQTYVGVDYFVDDCFETTRMLIATLLGIDEIPVEQCDNITESSDVKVEKIEPKEEKGENETTIASKPADKPQMEENVEKEKLVIPSINKAKSSSPSSIADVSEAALLSKRVLHRMQNLGIELAYKAQTRYHLDVIVFTATSNDYDSIKLASHLHALYSQTCNSLGRQHTVEVIGFNNNLQVFMDLIKKEQRLQAQRQISTPGGKYKSPVLSYAVDIVDCCVRHCEKLDYLIEHGANLLELAKNHETFESSVSAVLQEMFVFLKPLEAINIFAYDDITPLVEVITRSLEYITTFPGDLIMGLRILRHLAIGPAYSSFKSADTEELKHRFVSLQFYAADGVQTLVQILEKLCSYFEQPGLHSPALMTMQGLHCCQIMLPSLQVLREMLSFAIQSRDVQFKDLTAIDHLMKAYFLMHYFPAASQASKEIELAKNEVIQTLLAYTQPNEQDEESLNKSLWTQMIREILKNIDGPSTFIPGLQVLAELLPLPLPIPLANNIHLMEAQTQRLITERKLWSAHLHPQSLQISRLIETIAPSSFPPLSDLMKQICVHLADLAPNMTLLISRTLSDLLSAEWSNNANIPSLHFWRLLHFFSRLTSYATLKSSALSILSGKLWELFQAILTISEPTEIALKCQTSAHNIMKSFLNTNISLISPQSACTHELNLASALPPKELLPRIVDAILTNLLNDKVTPDVSQLAAKNLIMLSEHDITCHHLILALKLRRTEIQQWVQKLTQPNEKATNHISIELFLTLLCSLTEIEPDKCDDNSSTPQRTLKLKIADLSFIIGYQKEQATQPHVLQRIQSAYEQGKKTNDAPLIDINKLIVQLEAFEGTTAMEVDEDSVVTPEPTLPQAEGIVTQFAARPIFTSYNGIVDEDSQLSVRCWLPTPGSMHTQFDFDGKYERIACNLTELTNTFLPPETNLSSDCKRVLHLSASPQSNRERTPTAPCFRTRRVEVEPSTGRPEKKIYITPRGRGYARAPPSRGDLFRSRPPNTSRPPSLHVDDFLALETCGAQPTGPTGYNKIPSIMRGSRVGRNRGSRISSSIVYRKAKILRTSSPSTWNDGSSPHYRTATSEPHFGGGGGESHYSPAHFIGRPRGRARARGYLR